MSIPNAAAIDAPVTGGDDLVYVNVGEDGQPYCIGDNLDAALELLRDSPKGHVVILAHASREHDINREGE